MSKMQFTDGVSFDTSGPHRVVEKRDGLHVVGDAFLIPVRDRDEAAEVIRSTRAPRSAETQEALEDFRAPRHSEVEVQLTGEDGNAFAVLGRTIRALRAAGVSEPEIDRFRDEATAGDYNAHQYMPVRSHWLLRPERIVALAQERTKFEAIESDATRPRAARASERARLGEVNRLLGNDARGRDDLVRRAQSRQQSERGCECGRPATNARRALRNTTGAGVGSAATPARSCESRAKPTRSRRASATSRPGWPLATARSSGWRRGWFAPEAPEYMPVKPHWK